MFEKPSIWKCQRLNVLKLHLNSFLPPCFCVTSFSLIITVTMLYHLFSLFFSQLFGIILTSVLLYLYNSRYTPYEANNDDVVYEMARCQEKSPYPTRGTGPYANLYTNWTRNQWQYHRHNHLSSHYCSVK